MTSIRQQKQRLREQLRAARATIDGESYAAESASACDRLYGLSPVREAETLHLYWPIEARRELNVRPLIDRLYEEGCRIVLPVVKPVARASASRPAMKHRLYEGPESLQENDWGIAEPLGTETVPLAQIDVVIVPAFGAGRNRHRIGHGFGYYDAFLSQLKAYTACPVFSRCLLGSIPHEPHDVPLDCVVTPDEQITSEA